MRFASSKVALSLLLLAAIGLLAAGCGGSDEDGEAPFVVQADTTVTTGSVDKAQFVPRVNRICRRGWAIILENFTDYSGYPEQARLSEKEAFAESVRFSFLAGLDFHIFDSIFQMGAPAGEEKEVEEVIGAMQRAVELGQRKVRVASVPQLNALFARYNRLAAQYGFRDCLVDGQRLKRVQA